MTPEIEKQQISLAENPMYFSLHNLENVRTFMKYHVFAVWDFMALLKSLQKKITCVEVPWLPSSYNPELVRLVNEIVLGEESDIDEQGSAKSHFELYLKAMREVGAGTGPVEEFLATLNMENLQEPLREVISYHLDLALNAPTHQVAASFFYGREKLIPEMFESIVAVIEKNQIHCPTLIYYLKRHIELDADEHGPKAKKCLYELLDNEQKKQEAIGTATASLHMRFKLWNFIHQEMI